MSNQSFKIWAIVNLTPDSFYPGSRVNPINFVDQCIKFIEEGADILDIGAESSRPFSDPVTAEEEWGRLKLPLKELKKNLGDSEFTKRVSIDTYKPEIARKVLESGVSIINDISGGTHPNMFQTVSEFNAKIVIMHSRGKPKTMQMNPEYSNIIDDTLNFLKDQSEKALNCGVLPSNIIWDFGIGFGKNLDHNLIILNHIESYKTFGYPVMAGISRKSFLDKMLNIPEVEKRRDPTMIIHTILALHNIDILRVHDVKDTRLIQEVLKFIR